MYEESVTERQVTIFLVNKQQMLKEELKKVELALEALNISFEASETVNSNDEKNRSLSFIVRDALRVMPEFDPNSKLDNKIAFALSQKKDLTKDDILEIIAKHQPTLDKNKFERTLAVRLSYLLKHKMISGEKRVRSYIYNLLPFEISHTSLIL